VGFCTCTEKWLKGSSPQFGMGGSRVLQCRTRANRNVSSDDSLTQSPDARRTHSTDQQGGFEGLGYVMIPPKTCLKCTNSTPPRAAAKAEHSRGPPWLASLPVPLSRSIIPLKPRTYTISLLTRQTRKDCLI
jgi:hypothetical protein